MFLYPFLLCLRSNSQVSERNDETACSPSPEELYQNSTQVLHLGIYPNQQHPQLLEQSVQITATAANLLFWCVLKVVRWSYDQGIIISCRQHTQMYVIRHIKMIPEQAAVSPMQTLLFFCFLTCNHGKPQRMGVSFSGALWPWPPTWTECSKLRIKHLIPLPPFLIQTSKRRRTSERRCNSRSDALVSEQYGESSKLGEIILASTADVCRGIGRERPCGHDTACRGGHMRPFSLPTLVLRPCREHLSSHCHLLFVCVGFCAYPQYKSTCCSPFHHQCYLLLVSFHSLGLIWRRPYTTTLSFVALPSRGL